MNYNDIKNLNISKRGKKELLNALNSLNKGDDENNSGVATLLQSVTYDQLFDLKNNSQLIPGCKYRIIDYESSFDKYENWKSANHYFDVIVEAADKNILCKQACAIHSERDVDNYFKDSDLSQWKLIYQIENIYSTERGISLLNGEVILSYIFDIKYNNKICKVFGLGGTYIVYNEGIVGEIPIALGSFDNNGEFQIIDFSDIPEDFELSPEMLIIEKINKGGKGTILKMVDEYDNEAPYDFKNLLFDGNFEELSTTEIDKDKYYYTFSSIDYNKNISDGSISCFRNNKIHSTIKYSYGFLPNNIYKNIIIARDDVSGNEIYRDSYDNIIYNGSNNIIKQSCYNNIIGSSIIDGSVDNDQHYNNNIINGYSYNNIVIGDHNVLHGNNNNISTTHESKGNIFGQNCYQIKLHGSHNKFGNNCYNITLKCTGGASSDYNVIGGSCYNIKLTGKAISNFTISPNVGDVTLDGAGSIVACYNKYIIATNTSSLLTININLDDSYAWISGNKIVKFTDLYNLITTN